MILDFFKFPLDNHRRDLVRAYGTARRGVSPDAKYADLVSRMKPRRGVTHITEGKGFGSSGQLKVDGRIFAMLVRGSLVLKLQRERVAGLVEAGDGEYFDAGKGRPMREWFVLSSTSSKRWLPLAEEALKFVQEAKS